jgi:hypothetical protein
MIDLEKQEGFVTLTYEIITTQEGPYVSQLPSKCKWFNDSQNKQFLFFIPIKRLTFSNGL